MTSELRHLDELSELPEHQAIAIHLDRVNHGALFIWLRIFALAASGLLIAALTDSGQHWLPPTLSLVAIAAMFGWRRSQFGDQRFARWGFLYLLAQMVLFRSTYWVEATEGPFHPLDIFLALLPLFFRLPPLQFLATLAICWAPAALEAFWQGDYSALIGFSFFLAGVYAFGRFLTRRRTRAFAHLWARANARAMDQRRMKGELDQARQIQLSMLPQAEPYLPWLEVAGQSLPCSEVGGDYYDYFPRSSQSQAIVIADVAGHGMASGLILAAVRGCLVLLHDENRQPSDILAKLDRVVRSLGGRRTLVAMTYAVFEGEKRRVLWSTAGMPPVLHFSAATGTTCELLEESLPLGTALPRRFFERELALASGDFLIFASDGLSETSNARGELFGDDQLLATITRLAPGSSAVELRDGLLAEIAAFRGDLETSDDLTLVVARLK